MSLYNNKSTIQSVINSGIDNKMTVRELSLKEVLVNSAGEKFVINMFNLFEKYYELLMDNSIIVVLSDEEYKKYRFNPKLLSKDLYGTKELHYMLLRLNHLYSVIEFDLKEIRVFDRNITSLLNEIMVLESDNYIENEVDVIKKVNE
jgi:hypothetical protein